MALPGPPALQVSGANCGDTASLATPISLTPEKPAKSHIVSAKADSVTPCLREDGVPARKYVVFALPDSYETKLITAGARPEIGRIFAPDVSILDADGKVTRTFAWQDFLLRGDIFSVQFKPRKEERYLLVRSEPKMVGQSFDRIEIGVTTTSTYAAGTSITWNTGHDAAVKRTFSHEGEVVVWVQDPAVK